MVYLLLFMLLVAAIVLLHRRVAKHRNRSTLSRANSVFGSVRFDGVIPPMAEELQTALEQHGITLKIVNMTAGGDIDKEVYEWIEFCDTFLVFGETVNLLAIPFGMPW